MRRLVIVAASTARNIPSDGATMPAEKAYGRYQYERRRDYAREFGDAWLIFSAKWGLLAQSAVIDPTYVADDIEPDPDLLLQQLRRYGANEFDVIEVIAGDAYVRLLRGPAEAIGVPLSAPLIGQGLGMGQQSAEIHRQILRGKPFALSIVSGP